MQIDFRLLKNAWKMPNSTILMIERRLFKKSTAFLIVIEWNVFRQGIKRSRTRRIIIKRMTVLRKWLVRAQINQVSLSHLSSMKNFQRKRAVSRSQQMMLQSRNWRVILFLKFKIRIAKFRLITPKAVIFTVQASASKETCRKAFQSKTLLLKNSKTKQIYRKMPSLKLSQLTMTIVWTLSTIVISRTWVVSNW